MKTEDLTTVNPCLNWVETTLSHWNRPMTTCVKDLWFQFPAVGWPVKGSRRVNTEDATPGWRELDVHLRTENLTGFEGQTDSQMAEDIFSMGAFSSCEHLELITRSLCLEIKISPVVVLRVTLDQVVPFWYQRVNICACHDIHHLCLLLVFILYQFTQVSSLMEVMAWPSRMIAPPHKVKGLAVLILSWGWLCRSLAVVPTIDGVLNMFTVWSSVFSQSRLSCCCWVKRFSTWTIGSCGEKVNEWIRRTFRLIRPLPDTSLVWVSSASRSWHINSHHATG